MAYQITQTVTSAPTEAPNRNTNTPTEFSDNVDAQLSWERAYVSELQTLITQQNALSSAVDGYSTDAETAQAAAEAAQAIAVSSSNATIYSSGTTYDAGDVVFDPSDDYTAYTSQQGSNTGHTPHTDDGTWWVKTIQTELSDDTTPQLSGDLDCNSNQITKSSYVQISDATLSTGTHTFNYANGDMQQLTATGDITLATSNFVSGAVCSMIIDAVNWGAYTITHPSAWLFSDGEVPTYTASGTDRLILIKDKDDIYSLFVVGQAIASV